MSYSKTIPSSLRVFALCIWLFLASSRASPTSKPDFNWDRIKYFYVFGDSYSFVQGTEGYANYSFIGDAYNPAFTPTQLLSDEIIPKNTSSDGSSWPEFLTGCYQGLPSLCHRQLWDFAFAGADIDKTLLPLHHNFSLDLVDEVNQWASYAADVIPHPADETITAWWIGINDTGDTLDNSTITNFTAFWETGMTSYFNAVQLAYNHGLEGTYLFINVPPEERSPGQLSDAMTAPILKQRIVDFNNILATYVERFSEQNIGVNVLTFDAHTWFNMVLDNPSEYGFGNVTGYCTCTDDTYFWYNTGHPTQRVHELLAEAIETQLRSESQSGKS